MTNFIKPVCLISTLFILFQNFPLPTSHIYAQARDNTDQKQVEDFGSNQKEHLAVNLESTGYESEGEVPQEFSFVDNTFRTNVGQPIILKFKSTLPANQVLVRIPSNGHILDSEFSDGETIEHSHGEYWFLNTRRKQTTFILPVSFETSGQYFITIDHDADHFYLEVDEDDLTVPTIQEETGMSGEEGQIQSKDEDLQQAMSDFPHAVQPIITAEQNLEISEELIAAENERILEETFDRSTRSISSVRNWSQFRSAWNSSRTTEIRITANFDYSSSITGSSLGARSTNIAIIGGLGVLRVSFGNSSNILEMNGSANLSIRSMEFMANNRIVRHNGSGLVDISNFWTWTTRGGAPAIEAQNINLVDTIRIRSSGTTSPISVVRGGTLTINPSGYGYITGGYSSNLGTKPISSDQSSRIILNTDRLTMGTSYEEPRSSWHQVNATLNGINGSQVISSYSDPNDFAVRYTQQFNEHWYSSLIFNGSGRGFEPPIQTGTVTAKYVDSHGNELAKSESITGNVGTLYTTQTKDIDGWSLIEVPSNASGTFTQEPITVRYVYQRTKWSLSFQSSPTLGGSPSSGNGTLSEKETTTIRANPNDEYKFVKWEVISGTNAKITNATAESTTFTMGNSDVSIRAVYEKELKRVSPLDPLYPDKEIDPENPPIIPENQGLFSIDFISSFDFGTQVISAKDQTYHAKPQRVLNPDYTINEMEKRPNYIQISDRRPENERNGWQLAVTQKEQFKGNENQELFGTILSLSNQQVIPTQGGKAPYLQSVHCVLIPGNRQMLLKAQGNEGTGTWIYRFGDADTQEESVTMNVPKGANPESITYKTTLTWELSSVPNNSL
ncbi:WxL domain-containing protein [Enterococcus casseliflavus]|uniref:WxL domain-containing protein n=1 Tax=Enterococcus casseliflavus TaxID=37734 RepID=UPI0025431A1A|nr:WxL domain-containing protein [Enterococcus casseliflavus]MDK4450925.1 WxL domain-containing protein [Enterococcus casseliflavus]